MHTELQKSGWREDSRSKKRAEDPEQGNVPHVPHDQKVGHVLRKAAKVGRVLGEVALHTEVRDVLPVSRRANAEEGARRSGPPKKVR